MQRFFGKATRHTNQVHVATLCLVAFAAPLASGCRRSEPSPSSSPSSVVQPVGWEPVGNAPPARPSAGPVASSEGEAGTGADPGGCGPSTAGKTYDVGDGKPFATLGRVPWAKLRPGDAVRVHWRAQPYREKVLLSQSGSAKHPLRLCGVPGPGGERPVLDGENATTDASFEFVHPEQERRGLINVSLRRNGQDWGDKPRWIVIEGLELKNAHPTLSFMNARGETKTYYENAACVFVERGEHITMRNNEVHGCANGLFVASGGSEEVLSRDILIEGNDIHGNGTVVKNDRHHSIYTEAVGIVFQHNRFGPLREGSLGNQLKDRSVGTIVRYNWFEGGSRAMDLVEPEEMYPMVEKLPSRHRTYVYGNVVILGARASSRPIHYGGDNGAEETYRKGTLYFYDNTFMITTTEKQSYYTALLTLETDGETAEVRNNIVYNAGTTHLSWLFEHGTAKLGVNWASRAIGKTVDRGGEKLSAKVEMLPGGKTIAGDSPGFVNAPAGDLCLAKTSPARGVGEDLGAAVPAEMRPSLQYKKHLATAPRPARADLGALVCD